jgi:hypothetical protein
MEETYQSNGRDTNGKFVEGNTYGKGRPKLETERLYLHAVREACDFETWKKVVEMSVLQAKQGDAKARNFLANYLIGKPEQKNFLLIDTTENGESISAEKAKEDERLRGMTTEELNEHFDNEIIELLGNGVRLNNKDIIFVRYDKKDNGWFTSSDVDYEFRKKDTLEPMNPDKVGSNAVVNVSAFD